MAAAVPGSRHQRFPCPRGALSWASGTVSRLVSQFNIAPPQCQVLRWETEPAPARLRAKIKLPRYPGIGWTIFSAISRVIKNSRSTLAGHPALDVSEGVGRYQPLADSSRGRTALPGRHSRRAVFQSPIPTLQIQCCACGAASAAEKNRHPPVVMSASELLGSERIRPLIPCGLVWRLMIVRGLASVRSGDVLRRMNAARVSASLLISP